MRSELAGVKIVAGARNGREMGREPITALDFALREMGREMTWGGWGERAVLAGISRDFALFRGARNAARRLWGATLPTGMFVDFACPLYIYLRYI